MTTSKLPAFAPIERAAHAVTISAFIRIEDRPPLTLRELVWIRATDAERYSLRRCAYLMNPPW